MSDWQDRARERAAAAWLVGQVRKGMVGIREGETRLDEAWPVGEVMSWLGWSALSWRELTRIVDWNGRRV